MNEQKALEIVQNIFMSIFRRNSTLSLDEIREKFASSIKLPIKVEDSTTGEVTWTDEKADCYIKQGNMEKIDFSTGWMKKELSFHSIEELLTTWEQINYKTTERLYNCEDCIQSDTLYDCISSYRSLNCRKCKNVIYSEGCGDCEYLIACKNSGNCNYCIEVNDSGTCSNSYMVTCSSKISNSLIIQDCFNLHECIFCAHIANKRYCIGNTQLEKEEYFKWKKLIIEWILNK